MDLQERREAIRRRNRKKTGNAFVSFMVITFAVSLVAYTLYIGVVEYQPYVQAQAKIQIEKEAELMLEIEQAFKDQSKLKMTQTDLDTLKAKHKAIIESKKARTILDMSRTDKPRYIVEVMFRLWERAGGQYDYVPYAIAQYESNYNTFCHNTNGEDSRGLFQVNVPFHPNANPVKLFEPVYNMEYQFKELVQFEKKGIEMGLTGEELILYVARYGQRPNWEKCEGYIRAEVKKAYNEFQNIKLN